MWYLLFCSIKRLWNKVSRIRQSKANRSVRKNFLVNCDKAQLIIFIAKTRLEVLGTPTLFGEREKRTNQVKYLNLITGSKLTCNQHLQKRGGYLVTKIAECILQYRSIEINMILFVSQEQWEVHQMLQNYSKPQNPCPIHKGTDQNECIQT